MASVFTFVGISSGTYSAASSTGNITLPASTATNDDVFIIVVNSSSIANSPSNALALISSTAMGAGFFRIYVDKYPGSGWPKSVTLTAGSTGLWCAVSYRHTGAGDLTIENANQDIAPVRLGGSPDNFKTATGTSPQSAAIGTTNPGTTSSNRFMPGFYQPIITFVMGECTDAGLNHFHYTQPSGTTERLGGAVASGANGRRLFAVHDFAEINNEYKTPAKTDTLDAHTGAEAACTGLTIYSQRVTYVAMRYVELGDAESSGGGGDAWGMYDD